MPDTLLPPPSAQRTSARMRAELEQRARAACQSSYLGDHTSLCRVLGKFLCYVDTRDRHLAPHLIMNGFWEPWITVAIAQRLQPGSGVGLPKMLPDHPRAARDGCRGDPLPEVASFARSRRPQST